MFEKLYLILKALYIVLPILLGGVNSGKIKYGTVEEVLHAFDEEITKRLINRINRTRIAADNARKRMHDDEFYKDDPADRNNQEESRGE